MSVLFEVTETLGRFIVQWSWQLALFIVFLALIVRLDRRHRPVFRYRLFSLALVATLLLPWMPEQIASYSWTIRVKEVLADPRAAVPAPASIETEVAVANKAQADSVAVLPVKSAAPLEVPAGSPSSAFHQLVGLLWAVGVAVGAVLRVRERWRIRRIVARSKAVTYADLIPATSEVSLRVLLSPEVHNPMLCGLFRPAILLPSNIMTWTTPEERTRILRHETSHFAQRHHWFASLEGALKVVLFFHPLFRWMCRQLDVERELVCDADVVRQGTDANTYAETLLLVAEHAIAGKPGVYFAAGTYLNGRIEFLFRPVVKSRIAVMAVPLILLAPLLPVGLWEARIQAVAPLESRLEMRFVPPLPMEAFTKQPTETLRLQPKVEQNPVSEPAPAPRLGVGVVTLRGQGVANEVHITVVVPYALLQFSPHTSPSGTASMRNSSHITVDITNLNSQRVVQTNDSLEISLLASQFRATGIAVYHKVLLVEPGGHSIVVRITDNATGAAPLGTIEKRLEIPSLSHGALGLSSLVIADLIDALPPTRRAGSGMFAIGNFKVRPNVTGELERSQSLNLFQQVYGTNGKPLVYETLITTNGREAWRMSEEISNSTQVPMVKTIPLSEFSLGDYEIQTTVTDPATGEKVLSNARFSVQ